jgi:hypothetical protein
MDDLAYRREMPPRMITDWGAIWAGTFAYFAIWFVFGTLGLAVFTSAGYTGTWGYGVWGIILNVIAFYVAGHTCGSNASVVTRSQGRRHGLYMFGLANVGAILLIVLGSAFVGALAAGNQHVNNGWNYVGYTWPVWIALFLGFGAALMAASKGVESSKRELGRTEEREPVSIRPAA